MNTIPDIRLAALVGCVNVNPVYEYAPGELLVTGSGDVKARRPGWNHVRGDDGHFYPVEDAAGNALFPAAYIDPSTLATARVDRSEWADDADTALIVDALPG